MCDKGLIIADFYKSLSIGLIQANACNPSQFIAHDPQIPSLHDLFNFIRNNKQKYFFYHINMLPS
jgi:hypothetical protein